MLARSRRCNILNRCQDSEWYLDFRKRCSAWLASKWGWSDHHRQLQQPERLIPSWFRRSLWWCLHVSDDSLTGFSNPLPSAWRAKNTRQFPIGDPLTGFKFWVSRYWPALTPKVSTYHATRPNHRKDLCRTFKNQPLALPLARWYSIGNRYQTLECVCTFMIQTSAHSRVPGLWRENRKNRSFLPSSWLLGWSII